MPGVSTLHGIDIGGTKIGVCIGDADGRVLASRRFPTDHGAGPESILTRALAELEALGRQSEAGPAAERAEGSPAQPDALGVACPGPFLANEQRFLDPPNMPRWHNFALGGFLRSRVACPVLGMNDANAAALAEYYWGAGAGLSNIVFLTMSTGMGAGFVLDGRVYEGTHGFAGEIGHLRLESDGPVGFGRRGSVEGFLSGPGIVQVAEAERLICRQTGEPTRLEELAGAGGMSVEQICAAARAGDAAATRVTDRCADQLGRLLAMLTDILNPQVFILGTIGSAYPDLFIPRASAWLGRDALRHAAEAVRVVPSGLSGPGNMQALAAARLCSARER